MERLHSVREENSDQSFLLKMPAFITLKRGREEEPADEVFISMPEKRRTTMRDLESQLNQLSLNGSAEVKTKRIR